MAINEKGFSGFSSEEFGVGIKKSKKWKDETSQSLSGDYREIIASEIPTAKNNPATSDVKRIQRNKRNPLKIIGADMAETVIKQILNANYMNVHKDLIEAGIGTIQDIDSVETSTATVTDGYSITFASEAEALKIFDGTGENGETHLVGIYNTSGTLIDMDYAIARTGAVVDFAGVLSNVGSSVTCVNLPAIDFDEVPNTLLDIMVQKASAYDYTANPSYDGSSVVKVNNCKGQAKFEFPLQQNGTVEYTMMGDLYNYIDPSESRSPIRLTVEGTPAGPFDMDYNYFIKSNQQEYTGTISVTGKPLAEHLTDIRSAITTLAIPNLSVSIDGTTLNFGSSDITIDVVINTNGADASNPPEIYFSKINNYGVTAKNLEWIKSNKPRTILGGYEEFTSPNSAELEVTVSASGDFFKVGGEVELLVNGTQFLTTVPNYASDDTVADVADVIFGNLVDLVNAMDVYGELSFTAEVVAHELVITSKNVYSPLHVVVNTKGVDTVFTVDNTANVPDGELYDEEAPFTRFDKVYFGTPGEEMIGWCEAASITLDFTRDVKEIRSLCGSQGRKGWFNRDYTLYLEIQASDVDADRIYQKYYKFKHNQTFGLTFINKESGLAMFFPACRIEEHEPIDLEGITGHRYKINVNFDSNKKVLLTLPLNF